MNEKNIHWIILGGVIIIIALLFFQTKQIILTSPADTARITVTGDAQTDVMPDLAVLTLTVVTQGQDAQTVQEDNSKKMNTVLQALKDAGVLDKEIETINYNLNPWQEWDAKTQSMQDKGYRLQNTLQVKSKDVKNTGKLLDLAVKNGVNTVDGVYFTLSDDAEASVRDQLVAQASLKAKQKAQTLAKNLDVTLGKVLSVSLSSYTPPIYYGAYTKSAAPENAMEPTLNPKSVKVNIQINVDYGIK